jgi:hypothetical protein
MVTKEQIEQLVSIRSKNILRYAELLPLSVSQFDTFRKLILNELGKAGLIKELVRVTCGQEWDGSGRNTLSKEGGAP